MVFLEERKISMNTRRLFRDDVYKKECTATVAEIRSFADHTDIILDQTIFFPEGGGQPADSGSLVYASSRKGKKKLSAAVTDMTGSEAKAAEETGTAEADDPDLSSLIIDDVREDSDIIIHRTSETTMLPNEGDTVICRLDWKRRHTNMQRHLGEHILSGVFADLYGGANRGFHMGDSYITVDIRLENDPSFDQVTWDMCIQAEKQINEIIWSDLPVSVSYFDDPKEAAKMPLRKALSETLEKSDEISIVTVGSGDNIADCVACCGTHPSSTAQVGILKIYKAEKNKDMFRIYFDCGRMALWDYEEKHRLITDISDRHSAGLSDLEKKMAAEEAKNSDVRAHLNTVVHSLAQLRAKDILTQAENDPEHVIYRRYKDFTADDILKIGRIIGPRLKKPALILSEQEHTVMLFSDGEIHCGNLVRENAGIYGGKGGGSDVQARAIFPDNRNIGTFVDLIDKHLR